MILIKNRTVALILSALTFILGSVLLTGLIFYAFGIPLSSIWEGQNQIYFFFAVLVSAVLASMVYGRGSKERAEEATDFLNQKLDMKVREKQVAPLLKLLESFPPYVVSDYVSQNINVVEEFENLIRENTAQIKDEDLQNLRKILDMPVPDIQNLLMELYSVTRMEQLKILAEPEAEPLIELNRDELKRVLRG